MQVLQRDPFLTPLLRIYSLPYDGFYGGKLGKLQPRNRLYLLAMMLLIAHLCSVQGTQAGWGETACGLGGSGGGEVRGGRDAGMPRAELSAAR